MNAILSMDSVLQRLHETGTVIVDCRFMLGKTESGKNSYLQGHLPGAYYLDLEKDLSGPKGEHGGRHPLPDIEEFAGKLGSMGIDRDDVIIAYDDQGGAMASRLWWLLKYCGHEQAYVMDHGYSAWVANGYPVDQELPQQVEGKRYEVNLQEDMAVDMEQVKKKLNRQDGVVLIDSREAPRYQGITEPIDPVAGHIPGAVNRFWKEALDADGGWKPAELQAERFVCVAGKGDEVIVYCGSGVTACPNVMALKEAGYSNVKLYVGSWSDWCSYKDNPVATGEE